MNIDELRSAQSKERQKSDLQQLRESFYTDVAEYVAELEAERERAADATDDPFGSAEVQQLTNDIETAKDTAEAIYERRLGKIVKKVIPCTYQINAPDDRKVWVKINNNLVPKSDYTYNPSKNELKLDKQTCQRLKKGRSFRHRYGRRTCRSSAQRSLSGTASSAGKAIVALVRSFG